MANTPKATEKVEDKSQSRAEKLAAKRKSRVPLGSRSILEVHGKKPGYVYRLVAIRNGNVERRKLAGWEVVEDPDITIGGERVNKGSMIGTTSTVRSGDEELILMCIEEELFDEDRERMQREIDKKEQAMNRAYTKEPDREGQYGEVTIKR